VGCRAIEEEVSTSETLVSIYQTKLLSVKDDNQFHIRRRENLKSHL
jgi:hypothetical protein